MGKFRFGRNKNIETSEGFVWITFSDLLTTLFLVFMVIALWAISNRDAQKKKGEQCLEDLNIARETQVQTLEALSNLSHEITAEFELLKRLEFVRRRALLKSRERVDFKYIKKKVQNLGLMMVIQH